MFRISYILIFFISIIAITACNKPDDIGFDILPANDDISLFITDTITVYAKTIGEDTLPSRGFSYQIIGSYTDPVFGYSHSSCYAQLNLTKSNYSFGTDSVADSLVLCLGIKDWYGDTASPVTFRVYRLDEKISGDSTYYSNKTFIAKTEIGKATLTVNPHDSVSEFGVNKAPHVRIRLYDYVARELIAQGGTANLLDNSGFIEYFKGLYITADPVKTTDKGYLLSFDYKNVMTKMSLYYHNSDTDSVSLNFIMDDKARVNNFYHNYKGSEVGMHLLTYDSTKAGDDYVYVQSMAGVKTKISMPFLKSFGQPDWAINKAELIIKCDDNDTKYPAHLKIAVAGVDSVGKPFTLLDSQDGVNANDGLYNSIKKEYRYNITRYIQRIAINKDVDHGLYLLSTGAVVNMYRTKLFGTKNIQNKIRVEVNYSVF